MVTLLNHRYKTKYKSKMHQLALSLSLFLPRANSSSASLHSSSPLLSAACDPIATELSVVVVTVSSSPRSPYKPIQAFLTPRVHLASARQPFISTRRQHLPHTASTSTTRC